MFSPLPPAPGGGRVRSLKSLSEEIGLDSNSSQLGSCVSPFVVVAAFDSAPGKKNAKQREYKVLLTFPSPSITSRQYYEMLYNTADELLNLVVDQGVRYTELEYINALSLLHRSQTGVGDLGTQNIRLQRLKEIICEQAAIKQATKDKKITTV